MGKLTLEETKEMMINNQDEYGEDFEHRLNERGLNGNNGDNEGLYSDFVDEVAEFYFDTQD